MNPPTYPEKDLIIAIPGPWESRTEVTTKIFDLYDLNDPKFSYLVNYFADLKQKEHIFMDFVEGPEEKLSWKFNIAGAGRISQNTLDKINTHKSILFLHFDLDDKNYIQKIIKFTNVIQNIGGYALKLENCGFAHEFEPWFNLLSSGEKYDLFKAFVLTTRTKDYIYTCGMHNLSLPDCAMKDVGDRNRLGMICVQFASYLYMESPIIKTGDTISLGPQNQVYKLTLKNDFIFNKHSFKNPYGRWLLT